LTADVREELHDGKWLQRLKPVFRLALVAGLKPGPPKAVNR